jgi:hypothetical protein
MVDIYDVALVAHEAVDYPMPLSAVNGNFFVYAVDCTCLVILYTFSNVFLAGDLRIIQQKDGSSVRLKNQHMLPVMALDLFADSVNACSWLLSLGQDNRLLIWQV